VSTHTYQICVDLCNLISVECSDNGWSVVAPRSRQSFEHDAYAHVHVVLQALVLRISKITE
jgi:uncharacterized protein YhdP